MKITLILQENLFLLARGFLLPAPPFFTEISQLRPVFIFTFFHRSYSYEFSDMCKMKNEKFPADQQHIADTKGGK